MPLVTIQSQVINIPNTGASPIWSEAIVQFCVAVANALSGLIGVGDISKQFFNLDASQNPGTNVIITGLSFSSAIVRAGFVRYSVYRQTDSTSVAEAGDLQVVFDDNRGSGQKWEISRDAVGDAKITFFISDEGQFSFTTEAIAGSSHTGKIVFTGQATLQQ